jgi:eukaryotic-like serine/threonine-protein kinase
VLGDPRTADPCSVADARVLGRFGEARLDANYAGFNRCDVLIEVAGDDEIDVEFQFDNAESDVPATSSVSQVVRREPKRDGDDCAITLTLTDQTALEIVAKSYDDVDTDFCQVAAVAADHAEGVLRQYGQIPRRPAPDPRSLVNVDACGLLDVANLAAVPAYAGVTPEPGFANWTCRWQSTEGAVRVIFDRNDPDSAGEGTRVELSGREVYLVEEGYGEFTCAARIFHLRYQDEFGDPRVELALVVVEGGAPMPDLCGLARTFARPVAARLPAIMTR